HLQGGDGFAGCALRIDNRVASRKAAQRKRKERCGFRTPPPTGERLNAIEHFLPDYRFLPDCDVRENEGEPGKTSNTRSGIRPPRTSIVVKSVTVN
ncbi:MAG TPA: hypothetical protein VEY93_01635, partial [Longimicrobium sp.]|nr:hypothetical protein [Longimicrobium sp.]